MENNRGTVLVGQNLLSLDVSTPRLWSSNNNNVNGSCRLELRTQVVDSLLGHRKNIILNIAVNAVLIENQYETLLDNILGRGFTVDAVAIPKSGLYSQVTYLSSN